MKDGNVAKGTAKLRKWLENGEGPNSTIKSIAWATQRDTELRAAIAATHRMKREEAEVAFRQACETEAGSSAHF